MQPSSKHLIQALLLVCAFLHQNSIARPTHTQAENRSQTDVNPFPNSIPTVPAQDDANRPQQCFKPVNQTIGDGIVMACCDGFTGANCDEKVPDTSSGQSGDVDKVDFDPLDPCKNLECLGVEGAQCLTVSKCGDRWPVFLLSDGTLAECTNGQPVNVTQLTCSEKCTTDPCAGQTCSMFPDAFCVHTACNCNEPMWLLDSGVQVDCETGEHLSPEEAKSRRRRKRQTTQQQTTCS